MTEEKSDYAIEVMIESEYIADQSNPDLDKYVFAYTVTITNTGDVPAQLISRHWLITDDNNDTNEVKGLGVIGKQPLLEPGEEFEYTSGTLLNTPNGEMRGSYQFVTEDADYFEVKIDTFLLISERTLH